MNIIMTRIGRCCIALWLYCLSAAALALELSGSIQQGGLVHGRTTPGAKVYLAEQALRVSPDGVFVFGFGRDAGPEANLVIELPNGQRHTHILNVRQRRYQEQAIDGLPQNKVTPPQQQLDRIWAEQKLINAARARDDVRTDFTQTFIWPVQGRISGVYGSRRILNGIPKRPHAGVDIAAPTGTPVVAAADGVVSLVHQDMFYTGKTVMLQHGHGVSTLYIHLSAISVQAGQSVRQGEPIGAVGMTGRATGPHLHWGLNWFNLRLDPALLVPEP